MPTTTNVNLSVPAHGANVNVWDTDPVNNNSQILDAVFGSVTSISVAGGTTLTSTQLQTNIIRFTGLNNTTTTVNVSAIRKVWTIENLCTGTGVLVFTGGAGNAVAAPPGSSYIYWDGVNASFINLGLIGRLEQWGGTSTPPWVTACTVPPYLLCHGAANTFSSVTYPILAQLLGTTTLPDFNNRSFYGVDVGGVSQRITAANSGINGTTLFSSGGGPNLTLGQVNLPNVTLSSSGSFINALVLGAAYQGGGSGSAANGGQLAQVTVPLNPSAQQAATTISPGVIGGIWMIRAS